MYRDAKHIQIYSSVGEYHMMLPADVNSPRFIFLTNFLFLEGLIDVNAECEPTTTTTFMKFTKELRFPWSMPVHITVGHLLLM